MKTDKFTKVVLTIIAVNLTFLTLSNLDFIPKVQAQIVDSTYYTTQIPNHTQIPINEDGSINVKLVGDNNVNACIVDINTKDQLNVNIAACGKRLIDRTGTLSVYDSSCN